MYKRQTLKSSGNVWEAKAALQDRLKDIEGEAFVHSLFVEDAEGGEEDKEAGWSFDVVLDFAGVKAYAAKKVDPKQRELEALIGTRV